MVVDKQIFILLGTLTAAMAGFMIYLNATVAVFFKNKPKLFLYLFLSFLCFGITGLAAFSSVAAEPLKLFVLLQVSFLILGVIHLLVMYGSFEWPQQESFWPEFIFSALVCTVGMIAFVLVFRYLGRNEFSSLMAASGMVFMIPFFVLKTFDYAVAIPQKNLKKWYYPIGTKLPEPTPKDLQHPFVIGFEMQKKENDRNITVFRAKAPSSMAMGELFYHFLNDYNEKKPEQLIDFTDRKGSPYGWTFYFKPRWYSFIKYIDPERTVADNKIREDSVIVCIRSKYENNKVKMIE